MERKQLNWLLAVFSVAVKRVEIAIQVSIYLVSVQRKTNNELRQTSQTSPHQT
jgi:hypothetical protein